MRQPELITADELRDARINTVRWREGYDMDDADALLDRAADTIEAWEDGRVQRADTASLLGLLAHRMHAEAVRTGSKRLYAYETALLDMRRHMAGGRRGHEER